MLSLPRRIACGGGGRAAVGGGRGSVRCAAVSCHASRQWLLGSGAAAAVPLACGFATAAASCSGAMASCEKKKKKYTEEIVPEARKAGLTARVDQWVADGKASPLHFEPSLTAGERKFVHALCESRGSELSSKSEGTGPHRHVVVFDVPMAAGTVVLQTVRALAFCRARAEELAALVCSCATPQEAEPCGTTPPRDAARAVGVGGTGGADAARAVEEARARLGRLGVRCDDGLRLWTFAPPRSTWHCARSRAFPTLELTPDPPIQPFSIACTGSGLPTVRIGLQWRRRPHCEKMLTVGSPQSVR